MSVELRQDSPSEWTLIVDGVETVQRESFAVCDRVRWHLENPALWEPTECCEVADAIRKARP